MAKQTNAPKQIEILGYRLPVITFVGGVLTILYLFISTLSSGFLAGLGSVGAVALFTSLYSLIRNKPSWAMIPNKNVAGMVLAGSVILLFIAGGAGTATSPKETFPVVVDQESTTPSPTQTSTPTNSATQTPTSEPSAEPSKVAEVPAEPAPAEPAPVQAPAEPVFYYENCTAVRAAGAAPIHVGEYGYSTKLDRDGDGVACE